MYKSIITLLHHSYHEKLVLIHVGSILEFTFALSQSHVNTSLSVAQHVHNARSRLIAALDLILQQKSVPDWPGYVGIASKKAATCIMKVESLSRARRKLTTLIPNQKFSKGLPPH